MWLPPEFVALLLALSIYTASFIAEVVRAGILSVSHGQTEAASAVGLKQGLVLRLVLIPQSLRVIIPPLTNQYLNLNQKFILGYRHRLSGNRLSVYRHFTQSNRTRNRNYFYDDDVLFIRLPVNCIIHELV